MKILGIAGSLRKGSFNRMALAVAQRLAPADVQFEVFDLANIPPYNEDVKAVGWPESVKRFREAIAAADAVLITTPEYNYSIPGVLKNAIDWASRPPEQPFDGKPIAIMGASPGRLGTARAQYHLRQVFVFLNSFVLNKPEVMIAAAHQLFDEGGNLKDETTRGFIADLVKSLVDWTRRLG